MNGLRMRQASVGVTIEEIGTYDLPATAEVHAYCFEEPWRADFIRRIVKGPGGFGLCARREGRVLGFVLCRTSGSDGEILSLGVLPAERNQGTAGLLMRAATVAAWELGLSHLYLEVAEDNTTARHLYRGLGFIQIGRRQRYYKRSEQVSVDALTLRKQVDALEKKKNG